MKIEPLLQTNPIVSKNDLHELESMDSIKPNFEKWLVNTLEQTNDKLVDADHALQELASGQTTNLHQTMLRLEEAKLSFQCLEQIRNRLMSAYQEILREQI